jgi:hypothetical protein
MALIEILRPLMDMRLEGVDVSQQWTKQYRQYDEKLVHKYRTPPVIQVGCARPFLP